MPPQPGVQVRPKRPGRLLTALGMSVVTVPLESSTQGLVGNTSLTVVLALPVEGSAWILKVSVLVGGGTCRGASVPLRKPLIWSPERALTYSTTTVKRQT